MKTLRAFLFLSQVFFLWMFLSTQGLERMADAGLLAGPDPAAVQRLAYAYASQWRHGFRGVWPFYMPGFFAVSIATWLWCMGRPLRRLIPEGLAILSAALLAALWLSPRGAAIFLGDFQRATGIALREAPWGPGLRGAAAAFYTLLAWSAVVLAFHRALWWKSWKPLVIPILLEAVLFVVRPFTLDDLSKEWLRNAAAGNPRALGSLAAVPAVILFMVWRQSAWQRRPPRSRGAAAGQ